MIGKDLFDFAGISLRNQLAQTLVHLTSPIFPGSYASPCRKE